MTIIALQVDGRDSDTPKSNYIDSTVADVVRERTGWLTVFFVGLILAAVVVEAFEAILKAHVQLS